MSAFRGSTLLEADPSANYERAILDFAKEMISGGRAVFVLEAGPQHANPMGTLHGGVLCDVADAAMGTAYASTLGDDESFTTLELKINFLRPFWSGTLTATARAVNQQNTDFYNLLINSRHPDSPLADPKVRFALNAALDRDEIAALNVEHLGKAGPTDVLSFPLDDDEPQPGVPVLLGDVVVCPAVAADQALSHAGTLDDELALLVVHGVLHVLGHMHARLGRFDEAREAASYTGRRMPNFRMRACSVVRFIPSKAAAPFGPAIRHSVWRSARRICCRSASSQSWLLPWSILR